MCEHMAANHSKAGLWALGLILWLVLLALWTVCVAIRPCFFMRQ